MRFDIAYTQSKTEIEADVVIVDGVGTPFLGFTPIEGPLGGTELEEILLAEGLAARGKKVVVFNKTSVAANINGVMYYPIKDLDEIKSVTTKSLVSMRAAVPPRSISFQKVFFWCTDLFHPSYMVLDQFFKSEHPVTAIFVSEFQKSIFPQWNSKVIYNMVPDFVYDIKAKKDPNKFIYASAAMKGLESTLSLWDSLKNNYFFKKAELTILSPGYDNIPESTLKMKRVRVVGGLGFKDMLAEIASSKSMFYVNTMPETFGISPVMAEIVGTTPNVLCLNGSGALSEVLATPAVVSDAELFIKNCSSLVPSEAKNFRASKIMNDWMEIL